MILKQGCSEKELSEIEDLKDDDGDGVPNKLDLCKNLYLERSLIKQDVPKSELVIIAEVDKDFDGIPDTWILVPKQIKEKK